MSKAIAPKIELWPIDKIVPYERNPRINEPAIDAVARSIDEFGFRQPIVVDAKGVIVVGHTRWKAAKKLCLAKVPVVVAKDLSADQAKAYRIADNKTNELSDWDPQLLPLELGDLQSAGVDLSLLGFTEDQWRELLAPIGNGGLVDPDEIPDPPDEAKTRPGDLWLLGEHRLLCGDSSSPADLDRLLDGAAIHLLNTDPPYNVKVEPRSNNAIAAGLSSFGEPGLKNHQGFDVNRRPGIEKATHRKLRAKDRPLANDFVSDEAFEKMLRAWFGNAARALSPGRAFYIWGGYANCGNYPPALKACELYFSQSIIWHKLHPVLTRKDFMGDHEWCFYGWRMGGAHKFFGPINVPDVWPIKKVSPQAMVHLTEKPVELAARAMQYSTKAGENVLDLFGGSGSTLIAAEQQGRRAFLMELDGLYCDVIVERWEKFTGKKARRLPNEPAAKLMRESYEKFARSRSAVGGGDVGGKLDQRPSRVGGHHARRGDMATTVRAPKGRAPLPTASSPKKTPAAGTKGARVGRSSKRK